VKKLLHLQLLPLLSGVQNFSLHLLDGLPKGEFDIYVASAPGGEFVDAVRKRGYKHIPLRFMRHPISGWDIAAFAELLRVIRYHRFDIVHTNSSKPGLLGRLAASLLKVPLVLHTEHGTAFQEGQSYLAQKGFMALERFANRHCHKVVFVNNSDRERCLDLNLLPPEKAVSIYNALPYGEAEKLAELGRARTLKAERDDLVIGSTLRFSTQKNAVNLTGAACQACRREPRLRFILLGDGEQLELCRRIVQSHGLSERVLLPGWDNDIARWLVIFDAFILYSRWEAQPFSIIEAMHAGLPVIGSDIPSIRELVDEESGWLVKLDDHYALLDVLANLPRDIEGLRDKGHHAARRIGRICDYNAMVEGYLKIYRGEAS
jgi:glycosyltransferase involved in cell wall biosynthesis